VLVGERTFGKGVVQYYFPTTDERPRRGGTPTPADGSGVKVTVAKFITPGAATRLELVRLQCRASLMVTPYNTPSAAVQPELFGAPGVWLVQPGSCCGAVGRHARRHASGRGGLLQAFPL